MSEFARIGHAEMLAAYQRLLEAQRTAQTPEDREAADDDLTHYLRMMAAGRLPEWFASRQVQP